MFEHLETLKAISTVNMDNIKQVIEAVNRRLAKPLHAHVIRVYWREEAENGVILNPISYINDTQSEDPKRFELLDKPSVLSWVYSYGKSLWLEKLKTRDSTKPVFNKATKDEIGVEHLKYFRYPSDSMIVIPLIVRNEVHGIYAIELPDSNHLTHVALNLIKRLCKSLASLIANADSYEHQHQEGSHAITKFLNQVRDYKFDKLLSVENFRTGFIARSFAKEYAPVEESITNLFKEKKIRVKSYEPQIGAGFVINEIKEQIKNAHFCIADITGSNPNVLAEVGMMMILEKQFLLLRRKDDQTKCPFDIAAYTINDYDISESGDIRVWHSATNQFKPFETILSRFINNLPHDVGFLDAEEWVS